MLGRDQGGRRQMLQWRLGAEFVVVKARGLLRLPGNLAPACRNDKRIFREGPKRGSWQSWG
jgi:hypothetical protein